MAKVKRLSIIALSILSTSCLRGFNFPSDVPHPPEKTKAKSSLHCEATLSQISPNRLEYDRTDCFGSPFLTIFPPAPYTFNPDNEITIHVIHPSGPVTYKVSIVFENGSSPIYNFEFF